MFKFLCDLKLQTCNLKRDHTLQAKVTLEGVLIMQELRRVSKGYNQKIFIKVDLNLYQKILLPHFLIFS